MYSVVRCLNTAIAEGQLTADLVHVSQVRAKNKRSQLHVCKRILCHECKKRDSRRCGFVDATASVEQPQGTIRQPQPEKKRKR